MEILAALVPAVMLLCGMAIVGRMLFSGRAGGVFFGVLMRDFFWLILRGLGAVISLPFRLLTLLMAKKRRRGGWRDHPHQQRHRGHSRRSSRRHG